MLALLEVWIVPYMLPLGVLCHQIDEILQVSIYEAYAMHQSFSYKVCYNCKLCQNLLLDGLLLH